MDAPETRDSTAHGSERGLVRALGLFSATNVNMSQMVGIGPFITIPLMISTMGGPQALIGWVLGAVLAMCDGLVWAELGAAMPAAGGSYIYLREAYQYSTGRLMPFLFVWSTMLATPLIMSTGMVGMADYLGYFHHLTGGQTKALAIGLTVITVALLYRRIESVATLVRFLWVGMIVTVLLVIVATATNFNPAVAFNFPKGAFTFSAAFFGGLGSGLLIAIYDYLGYYTVAYLGDEVENPGYVMPRAIIFSILGVMAIYLVMNIGIMGVIPWRQAEHSKNIGTDAVSAVWGHAGGVIITVLIVITAFASVYCGLLGGSRLPYNAARDHLFFGVFGRLHPRLRFPHIALLAMGVVTAIGCLFSLSALFNALIGVSVLIQFLGGIGALIILRRKQPDLRRPYRQWLYPVPCIIALVGWVYVFISSGRSAIELDLVWTALGIVAYLIWAYYEKVWPFGSKEIREVFLEEQRASRQG